MQSPHPIPRCFLAVALVALAWPTLPLGSKEPRWLRIDSAHFSLVTDTNPEKGQAVLARFEQMYVLFGQLLLRNRVNMPQPMEIIAFKTAEEYEKVEPSGSGEGLGAGFYLSGDGPDYFVLNLAQPESWQAISYNFARELLNYNYPPAQPWFDEGFAEYFASARLGNTQMTIGSDPEGPESPPGVASPPPPTSFLGILSSSNWQSLPELFAAQPVIPNSSENRRTLFSAESWAVMHYLMTNDKLSDAGTYLGLVEGEKVPVPDAIQKAFGMNSEQLEKVAKDDFQAMIASQAQNQGKNLRKLDAPVAADQIGATAHDLSEPTASALIAEMELRLPEHREQAKLTLQSLIDDPKGETAIANRALGWYYLEKKDFDKSTDALNRALALDSHDVWTHFYLALGKERQAQVTSKPMSGVANSIVSLHQVLDMYPEFAQAYFMLTKAELEGGGTRAATDAIRAAIKLSPRSPMYQLELAQVYIAGNHWEAAKALLEQLAGSADSQVASAAQSELHDLPYLQKYGVRPQAVAEPMAKPAAPSSTSASQKPASAPAAQSASDNGDDDSEEAPAEPQFDRRKTEYLKGKLVAVDCSQAPVAVLTIASGGKKLTMRAEDYKSLVLIGADTFSCDWKDRTVSVNYKPGGKTDGDLISLEIR